MECLYIKYKTKFKNNEISITNKMCTIIFTQATFNSIVL